MTLKSFESYLYSTRIEAGNNPRRGSNSPQFGAFGSRYSPLPAGRQGESF